MTRKLNYKTISATALAIFSLALTSCEDNLERGANALRSEFESKESVTVTSTIDLEAAAANLTSHADSYTPPAYSVPANNPFSTSSPTSSDEASPIDYQTGFKAGFSAGFQEGLKMKEMLATRAATSIPSPPRINSLPPTALSAPTVIPRENSIPRLPLPSVAPVPETSSGALTYKKLINQGAPWSWIWQYSGTPLSKSADIHVLDGFDHSVDDFRKLTDKGSFPVAYFSCSYESWRPDAKKWLTSDKGKKMSGWDELWPSSSAIRNQNSNLWKIYDGRLKYFKQKISSITTEPWCFAIEWDNVDLYSSINLGQPEGLRFLRRLKQITEQNGFVFVLKNSTEIIDKLQGVQMYVNEEAQEWNELHTYRNVGRHVPVLNVEYRKPKLFPDYAYTIYYRSISNIDGNAITYDSKY